MKVTRLIREYVEKAVDSSYPEPDSVRILNETKNRTADAMSELNARVNDYITSLLPAIKAKYKVPDELKIKVRTNFNYAEWSYWDTELRCKADEDARKVEEEKRKKKDEILLALELGANRAELDEMIKNLITK